MAELKQRIAKAFMQEVGNFNGMEIHLCLPAVEIAKHNYEISQNYNAFIKALDEAPPEVQGKVNLHINEDATDVAQNLANGPDKPVVSLTNGANRKLIGNHWFEDGAKVAIDENIHRRSSLAATIAVLLSVVSKREDLVDESIVRTLGWVVGDFGGKIVD